MQPIPAFIRRPGGWSVLLLALLTSACSSTWVKTPQNRFESPEVLGHNTLSADVVTSGYINFAPNPNNPSHPTVVDDDMNISSQSASGNLGDDLAALITSLSMVAQHMGLGGRANISDHLELYYISHYEATGLRAKYQFLGEPASRARAGNLSLALDMGYGLNTAASTTQLYRYSVLDYALIGGYRLGDSLLIYGGPYQSLYLTKTTAAEAINARQLGANLGLRFLFGKRASLSLEAARSQMEAGSTHYQQTHYGLQVQFSNR